MGKAQRAHHVPVDGHEPAINSEKAENPWSGFLPALCRSYDLFPVGVGSNSIRAAHGRDKYLGVALSLLFVLPAFAQEEAEESPPAEAAWWQVWKQIPGLNPQIADQAEYTEQPIGQNTEATWLPGANNKVWVQDARSFIEPVQPVTENNVIEPLVYQQVDDEIAPEVLQQLQEKLAELVRIKREDQADSELADFDLHEIKLHIIGHTDSEVLSAEQLAEYDDKQAFTEARAALVAEYFQLGLELPEDAVTFEGRGDSEPLTDNITVAGRELNRRVEVQLSYFEIDEAARAEQVRAEALELNRVQVCRQETVCKLHYTAGSDQRARLKNLVSPLRL